MRSWIIYGPEVKSAFGKDTSTSYVVVRACALHGYATDLVSWEGYYVFWSDLPDLDTPCVVEQRG